MLQLDAAEPPNTNIGPQSTCRAWLMHRPLLLLLLQVISDCDPPSARVNASFVPYITQVLIRASPRLCSAAQLQARPFQGCRGAGSNLQSIVRGQPVVLGQSAGPLHFSSAICLYRIAPKRVHLVCHPALQRGNELIMYGGEFSDHTRDKVYVYKGLYRFNTDKQRWTQIVNKG